MDNAVNISPSITGTASALVGLGAGYALAPSKYTLEKLLMQREDVFQKAFSEDVIKNASKSEKEALANIKDASKRYFESGRDILKNKITPEAKIWKNMLSKVEVPENITKDLANKKQVLISEVEKSNYLALKKDLAIKQEKAKLNPNDSNIMLEMKNASKKFADAQLMIEQPALSYKKARETFRVARDEAVLKLPDKGKAISAQWEKIRALVSERANVMYETLSKLTESKSLNKDYKLIKKFIPKARTVSALSGGILAGLAGVVVSVYSVNKKHNT